MPETFETLGVCADLVQGLNGLGIQTPTPVKSSAIPFLLSAGNKGVSLTLIEASERGQITKLEQSLGLNFTLTE